MVKGETTSVLKNKRKASQFEVFHHLYKVRKDITDLLLRDFGYSFENAEKRLMKQFSGRKYAELTEEEAKYILGPQVNLWTEYVAYPEHAMYMLLPRLDAISEVQWMEADKKDFENFKSRLPRMLKLYRKLGYTYCSKQE